MISNIDKSWTLFLDRDGVINVRIPDDYVKKVDDLIVEQSTLKAISILSVIFGRIIVVTNQQGIGKGLMTIADLEVIHKHLNYLVQKAGGRIDKIYHSPFLKADRHFTRKPGVGMGIQAKKEFRDINFRKSVMVGDSFSDLLFGKRLGMKTVYIGDFSEIRHTPHIADFCYPDLFSFAHALAGKK